MSEKQGKEDMIQDAEKISEKVMALIYGKSKEAAQLGAVKAVNGQTGLTTRVGVTVAIKRGANGVYEFTLSGSVRQIETDTFEEVKDTFDPKQAEMRM